MSKMVLVLVTATAIIPLIGSNAEARSWTVGGRYGGSWTRSVSAYHNGGGNFGRTVTTTRPDGRTATRSFSRSVQNGTITDTRTTTGFNGKMRSEMLTRTPGQGGTATYTGAAGHAHTVTFGP
jgi:hypothetical protein